MYNNDDIQNMIDEVKDNKEFFKAVDQSGICEEDKIAIMDVLDSGWYEDFDRYDSAVCEYFITIYEDWKA